MSLNTSPLGATTLQINIGGTSGSNGLLGTSLQNAGLSSNSSLGLGGNSQNDTINQLAGMLTGMMMMMSIMGGGGLSSLLGNGSGSSSNGGLGGGFGGGLGGGLGGLGGGLGSVAGGELGSTLGGGLGTVAGGALGGPLGATVGGSLGSTLGGTAGSTLGGNTGSTLGSSLDQALGLDPTTYGDSSTSGSDSSSGMSPMEQLMKIFAEIMQSMFGDQDGSSSGSSTGSQPTKDEQNAYNKGVTDALTALMGGGLSQSLGNSLGGGSGLGGGTGLGGGSGLGGGTGLGGGSGLGGGLGGGNGLGGKSLQNLSGPADFQQLGNAVGTGVGMKAGIEALNNIGTHSDSSTRSFVNKEDRGMAKEVGQFMDQYPETFGKPQYQKSAGSEAKTDTKSWAEALSKPDDDGMTPSSMDQFSKAKGMIKSAMAGDTGNTNLQARGAGGSSLGIDAMLAGDAINNMALGKLSAA
ncbi:harpin HrpZ family protein [Erwinia mallotivora]|uniref:harpin HrpZ family protein n=1 Tax=Erwinia mallotivora TaxID=69222 RepID=UPI0021BF09FB|nr:harpin HrpZ family protein [Erwinia mallotivora]